MEYKDINWRYRISAGISEIVGKIPVKIVVETETDDYIAIWFDDGTVCRLFHSQECCESVVIDDINGNFQDLIGNPILVAEERSEDGDFDKWTDSSTWTFYTFRGIGGSVDVKWHGSSNGYYSESVDFQMVKVKE